MPDASLAWFRRSNLDYRLRLRRCPFLFLLLERLLRSPAHLALIRTPKLLVPDHQRTHKHTQRRECCIECEDGMYTFRVAVEDGMGC